MNDSKQDAGLTIPVFSTPGRSHRDDRLAYNVSGQLAANHIRSRVACEGDVVRIFVAPEAEEHAIYVIQQFAKVDAYIPLPNSEAYPRQNPRYIRVMAALRGPSAGRYKIMQLADGNERATMPIYHIPRRDRANGSYTSDEAIAAIRALMARDEQSGAIRRGQAAQAGYVATEEEAMPEKFFKGSDGR